MSDNESSDRGDQEVNSPVESPTELTDAVASVPDSSDKTMGGNIAEAGSVAQGRFALLIVVSMVVLADFCLYHAAGFAGPAVFLAGALVLLCLGIPRRAISSASVLLCLMTLWLSCRLATNGTAAQVLVGLWLLHAFTLALRRQKPFVLETLVFAAECIPGGYQFFSRINDRMRDQVLSPVDEGQRSKLIEFILPVVAVIVFGGIFVMANPDMVSWVSGRLGSIAESIRDFLFQFSPLEVVFWCFIAWFTGGLLRPVTRPFMDNIVSAAVSESKETALYSAFRNTLLTVIVLFGVYLVFEFRTLWFREFPDGFYYAGYAHQGAAWLTVALALATLTLSLIFRGITLQDPRLPRLRRLAFIWSLLNFVLAVAVYNRLYIYINFNGMTRMRTVGLLGISSVVGGFVLVLWKINSGRDFLWLIRRQLWVLGLAIYIYLALPVDRLIHEYNVDQIVGGNLAPVVQITGHEVDDEALPTLLPLCAVEDKIISSGIQAMLHQRFANLRLQSEKTESRAWTANQWGQDRAFSQLEAEKQQWDEFSDIEARNSAYTRLKKHAYDNWW